MVRKASLPILVWSLAKSGTTSVHKFFECGGYSSVHHRQRRNLLEEWGTQLLDRDLGPLVGKCIRRSIQKGALPLEDCGDYQVWSDLAFTEPEDCFFPAMDDDVLQAIYHFYPNATWIITTRDETEWYHSLSSFLGGKVLTKWNRCHTKDIASSSVEAFWTDFYRDYTARIDEFARNHPSLHYINVPLDEVPNTLSDEFDIPSTCFGHHRSKSKLWNQLVDRLETNLLLWNQS